MLSAFMWLMITYILGSAQSRFCVENSRVVGGGAHQRTRSKRPGQIVVLFIGPLRCAVWAAKDQRVAIPDGSQEWPQQMSELVPGQPFGGNGLQQTLQPTMEGDLAATSDVGIDMGSFEANPDTSDELPAGPNPGY